MNSVPSTQFPELGLVCITNSQAVRFRTMTRKRLLQFDITKQTRVLQDLYTENLKRLTAAIAFCAQENIHLYRLISNLFPFADEPVGEAVLLELSDSLQVVGRSACELGIRRSPNSEKHGSSIKLLLPGFFPGFQASAYSLVTKLQFGNLSMGSFQLPCHWEAGASRAALPSGSLVTRLAALKKLHCFPGS